MRYDSPSYEYDGTPYREPCPTCGEENLANNNGCSYVVNAVNHALGDSIEVITFHCDYCGNDYGVVQ